MKAPPISYTNVRIPPPPSPPRGLTGTNHKQVQEINPDPIPQLQLGTRFKMLLAMDVTEEASGDTIPLAEYGRPLWLIFHLKGVCNSNCVNHHSHQSITIWEHGPLVEWKAWYGATLPLTPVTEINTPPYSDTGSTGDTTIRTNSRTSRVVCIGQKR